MTLNPRPIKDQSKQMLINTGMVIIQMVDIDFEEKSVNMNVEFIMDWQDQFIQINQVGYSNNVVNQFLIFDNFYQELLYIFKGPD